MMEYCHYDYLDRFVHYDLLDLHRILPTMECTELLKKMHFILRRGHSQLHVTHENLHLFSAAVDLLESVLGYLLYLKKYAEKFSTREIRKLTQIRSYMFDLEHEILLGEVKEFILHDAIWTTRFDSIQICMYSLLKNNSPFEVPRIINVTVTCPYQISVDIVKYLAYLHKIAHPTTDQMVMSCVCYLFRGSLVDVRRDISSDIVSYRPGVSGRTIDTILTSLEYIFNAIDSSENCPMTALYFVNFYAIITLFLDEVRKVNSYLVVGRKDRMFTILNKIQSEGLAGIIRRPVFSLVPPKDISKSCLWKKLAEINTLKDLLASCPSNKCRSCENVHLSEDVDFFIASKCRHLYCVECFCKNIIDKSCNICFVMSYDFTSKDHFLAFRAMLNYRATLGQRLDPNKRVKVDQRVTHHQRDMEDRRDLVEYLKRGTLTPLEWHMLNALEQVTLDELERVKLGQPELVMHAEVFTPNKSERSMLPA